jgi:CoA:oxalate CoA-transferase
MSDSSLRSGRKTILDGVRVLDLSTVLAGPMASMLLADMGAEVIKIERPPEGDEMRHMPPYFHRGESAYFISVNRNKQSVVIDLKTAEGKEVFLDLVRKSDIVFNNARVGVMDRLGFDYASLSAINPRIICCSLSGFGRDSPYKDRPGYDLNIQAMSGVISMNGEPGRPPARLGISMGDLSGAMYSAFAMVNALYFREKTGRGQDIDMALLDSIASLLTYQSQYYWIAGVIPQQIGSGHITSVPYQAFETRDGWVVIDAHSQKHWRILCETIGMPQHVEDPKYVTLDARRRNKTELVGWLGDILKTRSTDEWMAILAPAGIPASPINTVDRALADPSLAARKMIVEFEHTLGGTLKSLGNPVHMSEMKEQPYLSPPLLGEHTEQVLRDVAGYDEERIGRLVEQSVVYTTQRFER